MKLKNSTRLSNRAQLSLGLRQKILISIFGGSLLIMAGVLSIKQVTAIYTISGYVFLDYNGDKTENEADNRLPVVTINVYSDEDDSNGLSAGDLHLATGITDSSGSYSIDISTVTTTLSTRILSEKDDAEEDVSDGAMNLTSSDLELMKDGSATQMVGIRFGNVNLPAGATVTSAYIRFQAKNNNNSTRTYKIQGERDPFSDFITKADSNISKRDTTINSQSWTISTWNSESYYNTADLTTVVNEIRNQSGWFPGNPMMFMLSGTTGTKVAYSGTEIGPELYIDYILPAMTHDFIIAPDTNLLHPGSTVGEAVVAPGSASGIGTSFRGESLTCYVVSDEDPNTLLFMNRVSRVHAQASDTARANDIEAITYDASRNALFAVNSDRFGTLDLINGIFIGKPDTMGKAFGATGTESIANVNGLTLDPFSGKIYASNRESGNDILFIVDTVTGKYVADAFGPNEDYVVITGVDIQPDIDDIAISPIDGRLYGVNNGYDTLSYDFLVEIDKATGATIIIDTLKFNGAYLSDIEGLTFSNYGDLLGTTGDGGGTGTSNVMYNIDLATATATLVERFGISDDYEGCECLSAAVNRLEGYVFEDLNSDAIYNVGDAALPGVRVRIYRDVDQSGTLNAGDVLIDSLDSNLSGYYSWFTASNQDFVTEVVASTAPANYVLTTIGERDVLFNQNFGGTTDSDNDFGLIDGGAFPIEGLSLAVEWDEKVAALEWETTQENNSSHFMVERSLSGRTFRSLGKVKASGFSDSPKLYTYRDIEAGPLGDGPIYYRLKQVDQDGKFEFSKTVILHSFNQDLSLGFSLYPNPAGEWVNIEIEGPQKEGRFLSIIDIKGQVVEKIAIEAGAHHVRLRSGNWAAGIYTVRLDYEGESPSHKLIVK